MPISSVEFQLRTLSCLFRRHAVRALVIGLVAASSCAPAQDQPAHANFFLPQNPVAAAYVLSRLSNQELISAPRSEFVYVALLQRNGLERKYRVEALEALAKLRNSDAVSELLRNLSDLDTKGEQSLPALQDLGSILLSRSDLSVQHAQLEHLAQQSALPATRQIGWAARIIAEPATESVWQSAQSSPAQLQDMLLGLPKIPDSSLRSSFYPRVKELLRPDTPAAVLEAAAQASVAMPGHETETFSTLASLVHRQGAPLSLVQCLADIPVSKWQTNDLSGLAQNLVEMLQKTPPDQRADNLFTKALQFATEVASRLPVEAQKSLTRILRGLGPTVITLHAVYEQMRFDKDHLVVETDKPVLIILQNDDAMPHNLAVLAPGALQEIGQAAEKMPAEPDAQGRLYVPSSAKLLHATKLVAPGQQLQLSFNAPTEPGDYPYVCTFPGHWLRMSGVLSVVPDLEAYLASHPVSQQPQLTEWKLTDFRSDLAEAKAGANPAAGRDFFEKLACVQCHRLGEQGYAYGPDLTEVFKRFNNDRSQVLEQILEPSKRIDDRYRNVSFDFKDGESQVGMIVKQDDQSVTIQTGPADTLIQVLKKSEIQKQRLQNSSPMPVGLLNSLSKKQILDLLAYLEAGGKLPPTQHSHAPHG